MIQEIEEDNAEIMTNINQHYIVGVIPEDDVNPVDDSTRTSV